MRHLWALLLSVQKLIGYCGSTSRIAADERVLFFPTAASQWNATHWHVPIHGWIFEPEENSKKRRVFRSLLRRALKVPSGSASKQILDRRIQPFVFDNERFKQPIINLGGKEYTMSPSGKNGHFQTSLILPHEELFPEEDSSSADDDASSPSNTRRTLSFFATSSDKSRKFPGTLHFVPPEGITIVSDIDDTIKITNVVDKKEMLRNTFLRDFSPVPGMAQVYRQWCLLSDTKKEVPHVHLHLLSASMFQLYEDLEQFRHNHDFPPCTYTLKIVRPKDAPQTIRILLEDAFDFKRRSLVRILESFPKRQFILVGDTGEKDPHVYASIAKDYPHQILGIYLRLVARTNEFGKEDVRTRVEGILKEYGINPEGWTVFEDAKELEKVDLRKLFKKRTSVQS